jgi:hypothetical protein
MDEPTADSVEQGLADYVADRVDLPGRLPALIEQALARQPDDHAASMLRRGGQLLVKPLGDGTAELVVAFTEGAEVLAAMRAAAWEADPEQPPAPGSDDRGEIYVLATFPVKLLATVPQG